MFRFSSLVWVVCENHGYHQVEGLQSHQRLLAEGAVLTNYFSITHPSGPNYRSLAAGRYFTKNELLGEENPTFASAANVPVTVWNYRGKPARRHNPFFDLKNQYDTVDTLAFDDLPERCLLYVGMDDNNNGHSGPLSVADDNLMALIDGLEASSWFNREVDGRYPALFVVWDEAYTASNQVFAAFLGRGVQAGAKSDVKLNHFSFCRLCCENFGAAPLAHSAEVETIDGIWIE